MTEATLARARAGDEEAFGELTGPYRRELQLHCYRILGSTLDAEDLLQETLLAAWRGLDGYEGRASLRSWLYRVATNQCLNALRANARRPPTIDAVRAAPPAMPQPNQLAEAFVEPYPDVLIEGVADITPGPEARYEMSESVALAFVAALQQLPPRQRTVLVLRDVLGFRAAEVADMLEMSEIAVKGALQRARATLEQRVDAGAREAAPLPSSSREREIVARFGEAFERGDVEGVVSLLTGDATFAMPPEPGEYCGREAIGAFLAYRFAARGGRRMRLVPTRANGQPAFGLYLQDPMAPIARSHGLLVLTLEGDRVRVATGFRDNGVLQRFGLPRTLRDD